MEAGPPSFPWPGQDAKTEPSGPVMALIRSWVLAGRSTLISHRATRRLTRDRHARRGNACIVLPGA